jgi:glycosyltransferase involved in cell wall biosynthesis
LPPPFVWVPGDGAARDLAAAAEAAGRADLAILMPGIQPFGAWLERLTSAARSETTIATASAMRCGAAPAPSPLAADDLEGAAASVAAHARCLRPRIGEPLAGCVLVRRTALDLARAADDADAGTSPAAQLASFAQRCSAIGLSHVLADDVLVAGPPVELDAAEEAQLDARFTHRRAARELDARPESPLEHAVLLASRGLDKLSVTIDGRGLGPSRAGTQVHALELIAALGRTDRVRLRVVTQPDLDPHARSVLEQIEQLELLPHEAALHEPQPPTDIVHRPSQVFSAEDLTLLLPLGHRIVVTHQDLIAYRIGVYHESAETWQRYRRVTEATLSAADHVVFFSEHALADALADALVDPASATVVPIGVDHQASAPNVDAIGPPPGMPDDGAPFLLCLGAGLRHKNHPFAVRLTRALRAEHGWQGRLVFAGPSGGDGAEPAAPRDEDPDAVVRLGPVSEAHKAWLLASAAAVVYPTLYEGFGLIPFEAGAAGVPCLFAAQTSLAELLPADTATIVPWDERASASAAVGLLHPGPAREAHVAALREAAVRLRWDDTARALVDLYDEVLVAPPRELRRAPRERLLLEQRLRANEQLRHEEWQRYEAFREQIGSDALGLVGPDGVLSADDQRALLALLSRERLRRPVTRATRAAYRLAMKLRAAPNDEQGR